MKGKVRIGLITLIMLAMAVSVKGQRPGMGYYNPSAEKFGHNTLSIQTTPLIFGGYGFSYGRNLVKQHWLGISPVLYTASNMHSKRVRDIEKMFGYSVNLNYRYNYFEMPDVGFKMFFHAGLEYFRMDLRNVAQAETQIEKAGMEVAAGFHKNIAKPLYFEFWFGYGQRWLTKMNIDSKNVAADVENPDWREPRYDSHIFGYGRAGSSLVIGLNVGFLF